MGVIIGSKAQNAVWAQSVDWLAQRSGSVPMKTRRPAAGRKKTATRRKRRKA